MLYIAHVSDLKRVNAAVCVVTILHSMGVRGGARHTQITATPQDMEQGVHSGECIARADT